MREIKLFTVYKRVLYCLQYTRGFPGEVSRCFYTKRGFTCLPNKRCFSMSAGLENKFYIVSWPREVLTCLQQGGDYIVLELGEVFYCFQAKGSF